jgi:WD40 repeat protein
VVSGSLDLTLRVWNVETGSCERVLRDHKDVGEISFDTLTIFLPMFLIYRRSTVFVPCIVVIEWYQDLMTILFECGMWRQDPVSEC